MRVKRSIARLFIGLLAVVIGALAPAPAHATPSDTAPPITQQAVPQDIWDHVVGVYSFKAACEAARISVGWIYPRAYCTSNPDSNGTWLLIDDWKQHWSLPGDGMASMDAPVQFGPA